MKPKDRQQLLVVLTIVAVALYAGDLLLFEPMAKWFSARSQRITTLRQQVKDGRVLLQREAGIRSRWDGMRTNTLPQNSSQAEQQLLRAFDNWVVQTGAQINDILPQWKNDADDHMTLNCRVEAGGDIGTLGQFLYEIEKSPMALKLDTVELAARDNAGQQLTLNLEISGLVLTPKTKP
jgi:hypothetical protein